MREIMGQTATAAGALPFGSWIDVLIHRATDMPTREALTFLLDGESQQVRWDYRTLDARARAIGARLGQCYSPGDRALLLYQPGPEFIAAFFGCLYAGVIAVPAYPPRSAEHERAMPRLGAIARDADPAIVLTASQRTLDIVAECVQGVFQQARQVACIDTETLPDELGAEWKQPAGIDPGSIAFLQYTSGSTSSPKGVVVSHGNLLHNCAAITAVMGHTASARGVNWLPPYHDMGLIGTILQPLFVGFPMTLMPPASFLQKPLKWLKAITAFKGTTCGGPDFAYDLCVRSIKPQDREGLDLSSWRIAFSGAEPVRRNTIDRFVEAFAPHGFRPEAFYPCYGLAEATLMVSGGKPLSGVTSCSIDPDALRQHRIEAPNSPEAQTLVGCGDAVTQTQIAIVDPQTLKRCKPDQVGEIWVRGPGVAQGYWKRPDVSLETFAAQVAGDPDQSPWLRTGDLGFFVDGQLCIAGRMKDLIIIRGRNHYPNDIEHTAGSCHPALRPGGGAAFGIDINGSERLVIYQEVERTQRDADPEAIFAAIRESIAQSHEVQPHAIVLLKPSRLPRTSSGKVRRHACREAFSTNEDLGELARWNAPEVSQPASTATEQPDSTALKDMNMPEGGLQSDVAAMQTWLAIKLATALGVAVTEIEPAEPFARYGLDSANAVALAGEIGTELGLDLEPTLFWDYPCVQALAEYLSGGHSDPQEPTANRAA
jgi:acyl-CoA synthetase (AMP-forming)/AMP-acid ligase II/acyl carrier protein